MKKIFIVLFLLACSACDDDGISNDHIGCVTGIRTGDNSKKVVTIGCATKSQSYNFALIHVDYTDIRWAPAASCDECK